MGNLLSGEKVRVNGFLLPGRNAGNYNTRDADGTVRSRKKVGPKKVGPKKVGPKRLALLHNLLIDHTLLLKKQVRRHSCLEARNILLTRSL